MKGIRWNISAGAILLFALLYFFDESGVVSAMLPAALAHELGHILALRLCGRRLIRFGISLTGAQLDYAPRLEGWRAVICLLSGPAAGLAYAVASCTLGGTFWRMSGAVSCVLSVFNLLPILPLDGGRIVASLLPETQARRLSLHAAFLFFCGGAVLAARFLTLPMLMMGGWLTICNLAGKYNY